MSGGSGGEASSRFGEAASALAAPSVSEVSRRREVERYASRERRQLRREIRQMRAQQAAYLKLSIVLTVGALVLIGISGAGGAEGRSALWLAPLLVTLPSCWLFFGLAEARSRIVGYLRVLDSLDRPEMAGERPPLRYEGWDRAHARFREVSAARALTSWRRWRRAFSIALVDALLLRGETRPLAIHWYAFAVLSGLPLGLAASGGALEGATLVAFALIGVTALYNLYLLGDLSGGERSEEGSETIWLSILGTTSPETRRAA